MYRQHRHPKTHQERAINSDGENREYVRLKRNAKNVPSEWSDLNFSKREMKSWKEKRRTKYRTEKRGTKHSIYVEYDYVKIHKAKTYFEKHNIPYSIENVYLNKWYWCWHHKKMVKGKFLTGHQIFWWYNKDIGINHIIGGI